MIPTADPQPNASSQSPRLPWWKPALWLPVLIGVVGLQALILLGGLAYYAYIELPEHTFAQLQASPWRERNVNAWRFKTPSDFAKALHLLVADTRQNRDNPAPAYLLAELENTLAHSDTAMQSYQRVIRLSNANWYNRIAYRRFADNAHAALAILYYQENKSRQAQTELDAISDFSGTSQPKVLQALHDTLENPDRADFHLLLGQALRHQLRLDLAHREILTAERLSQSPPLRLEASNFMKTQMPRQLKDLPPLTRYFSLAGKANPNPALAAAFYEQAIHDTPDFEWGYSELAILYRGMRDYARAVQRANQAIALNPNFYNPYLTLGDIALDRSDYPAAIRHFKTAQGIIQRLPDQNSPSLNINIENQLGYAYELMNQMDAATHHYQLAMLAAADADSSTTADYNYAQDGLARMEAARHQATERRTQLSWHP